MKTLFAILLLCSTAHAGEVTIYSGPTLGWHKVYKCTGRDCVFDHEGGPTDNRLPTQPYDVNVTHDGHATIYTYPSAIPTR